MTDTTAAPVTPEPKVPVASESIPEPKPGSPEPSKAESSEQAPPEPQEGDTEAKRPRQTASERISQIHAQKKAAEASATMAWREVARLKAEVDKIAGQSVDELPYEQQNAHQLRSVVKQERLAEKLAEAQSQAQVVQEKLMEQYRAKLDAATERIPDLVTTLRNIDHIQFSQDATELIIESDKAAELSYFLGQNANEAARIASLPPGRQAYEIARLEQRLTLPSRKTSNAPPPVPTIATATAAAPPDLQAMSAEDYVAMRKKQWAAGQR